MTQHFAIHVPQDNAKIWGGAGDVSGIGMTTDSTVFTQSGADTAFEARSDMKLACLGLLAAGGTTGVVVASPATIQATAGAAVQIYAGAGQTPPVGAPGAPGGSFGPSAPAEVHAGERAEALNRINDGIKAAGDLADIALGVGELGEGNDLQQMAGGLATSLGVITGAVELGQAIAGPSEGGEGHGGGEGGGGGESAMKGIGIATTGLKAVAAFANKDWVGGTASALGAAASAAGFAGGGAPMSGAAIADAKAAQAAAMATANKAGMMSGAVDGPRIHMVAPANIDRECGADMTAKVAGKKETKVDGKIEYTSGASVGIKAFTKIETSSLVFEASANVSATMKGLASAKVESLGQAVLEGKAKFKVETMASGTVAASKLTIEGKATTKIESPKITIGNGTLEIESTTKVTKDTTLEQKLEVGGESTFKSKAVFEKIVQMKSHLYVSKNTTINEKLKVNGPCQFA